MRNTFPPCGVVGRCSGRRVHLVDPGNHHASVVGDTKGDESPPPCPPERRRPPTTTPTTPDADSSAKRARSEVEPHRPPLPNYHPSHEDEMARHESDPMDTLPPSQTSSPPSLVLRRASDPCHEPTMPVVPDSPEHDEFPPSPPRAPSSQPPVTLPPQPPSPPRPSPVPLDVVPEDSQWRLLTPAQRAPLQEIAIEDDTYTFMLQREQHYAAAVYPRYFSYQRFLSPRMRCILVDWMEEVCQEFALRRETFYMAVSYVDHFLSEVADVQRSKLQLVGVTALFLAAKLEEINMPRVVDFVLTTDNSYTVAEITKTEKVMQQVLNWDLLPQTPYAFLAFYLQKVCRYLVTKSNIQLPAPTNLATPGTSARQFSTCYLDIVRVFPMDLFSRMMDVLDAACMDYTYLHFLPSRLSLALLSLVFTDHEVLEEVSRVSMSKIQTEVQWIRRFSKLEIRTTPERFRFRIQDPFLFQTYHARAMAFVSTHFLPEGNPEIDTEMRGPSDDGGGGGGGSGGGGGDGGGGGGGPPPLARMRSTYLGSNPPDLGADSTELGDR